MADAKIYDKGKVDELLGKKADLVGGKVPESQLPQVSVTVDDNVTKDSANPVKSSGIWSAIWGALTALPTGFSSLYDWCVSQLADKADASDIFGNDGKPSDTFATDLLGKPVAVDAIHDNGGVQHDANGYFIDIEV